MNERSCVRCNRVLALVSCLAALLVTLPSAAELTDSEKGQIRSYVESTNMGTVSRLRALIARPDLSEPQTSTVLSAAVRPHVFDDRMSGYFDALLFGPSSQASRSVLAPSVVRALLSRADAVFVQQPGDPMKGDPRTGQELMRIHAFVDGLLNKAAETEARGVAGLSSEAKRSIYEAYAEHIERHRSSLSFASRAEGRGLMLRALVARLLLKAGEGSIDRSRIAETLSLSPAPRTLFVRTGTLFDDGGGGPEVRRGEVISMLARVPDALRDIDLVVVGKVSRAGWPADGRTMFLRTPLGPIAPRRDDLWPSTVRRADPEQAMFETAWVASSRAIRARLRDDAQYASHVEQVMMSAAGKGSFGFIAPWVVERSMDRDAWQSLESRSSADFTAAVTTMLLLDVQRTVDLASLRFLAGRPESFEQVMLGLDTLAPRAIEDGVAKLELGKVTENGIEPVEVQVLAKEGRIIGLSFEGHRYEAKLGPDGDIRSVHRDGAPFEAGDLSQIDVPTSEGDRWLVGTTEIVRLFGHPRIGALGQRRFVMVASDQAKGLEAVYTEAPTVDHAIRCRISIDRKGQAGMIVRASTAASGFHGAGVLIDCESRCTARLVRWDGTRSETVMARPIVLSAQAPAEWEVSIVIASDKVRAKVGDRELGGTLATPLPVGHAGWVVGPGARLSGRDWSIEDASP